jgi:hypothetical protein
MIGPEADDLGGWIELETGQSRWRVLLPSAPIPEAGRFARASFSVFERADSSALDGAAAKAPGKPTDEARRPTSLARLRLALKRLFSL